MTDPFDRLTAALADRYRLERELGAGGMATVYLAEDLKHHRRVALKVLHPDLAAVLGAERFLSEIRTTANLQHPHILPLHDSGQADGLLFYVMPFVEGESLRARLERERQLPVEEAVRITREVASALDYAHRHGVIHRDIKPENILLHEGQALIADFGIALAVSSAGETRMTQTGMSLGTPEYMSPEQALGERSITARSDVYALGCVLYEMLTGEPPFTGATVQAIVARVLNEDPRPVRQVRKTVPPHIEAAALHALGKLPADRFGSAAEFVAALENPAFNGGSPASRSRGTTQGRAQPHVSWPMVVAVAALVVTATWGWLRDGGRQSAQVQYLPVALDAPYRTRQPWAVSARLSPDGQLIGYHGGGGRLFLVDLSSGAVRPANQGLPAALSYQFSPASDSLVYRTTSWNGQLYVVSLRTAQGRMIADSALSHELAWSDDGWIYYGDMAGGLSRVRPDGSERGQLVAPDPAGLTHVTGAISALPGGAGVLFAMAPYQVLGTEGEIRVLVPRQGESRRLGDGVESRYLPSGHLIVVQRDGALLAASFDLSSLRVRGAFHKIMDSVETGQGFYHRAAISLSDGGDLLYIARAQSAHDELLWAGRDGVAQPTGLNAGGWLNSVAVTQDGSKLAISVHRDGLGNIPNIWVADAAAAEWRRLTYGTVLDYSPNFLAGGRDVAFVSPRDGRNWDLYVVPFDGSGEARVLLDRPGDIQNPSFSRDDRWVAFCERDLKGQTDLMAHRLGPDSMTLVVAGTPALECQPAISRDGRWLAYVSDESGRNEVYVVPFPAPGGSRWQVSTEGATGPAWSRDGSELFVRGLDGTIAAIPVTGGATFTFRAPRQLFQSGELGWGGVVDPRDGSVFMIRRDLRAPGRVVLIRNFLALVREKIGG